MSMQAFTAHSGGQHETVLQAGSSGDRRVIENGFPFETLAEISELESWRKEIHRPVYHMHKWWAQRLGSVFRACILACFVPEYSDILRLYYEPTRLAQPVVFDPFMGSGTTLGEALKLGCRVVGRDINPVAYTSVAAAMARCDRGRIVETFREIEADTADRIKSYYQAQLETGEKTDALYYFWVRVVRCRDCGNPVKLFNKYIFAQHAYASKNPEARAVCPNCGDIILLRFDDRSAICHRCGITFDPHSGSADGMSASCSSCGKSFPIAKTVRELGGPLDFEMYAKLILLPNGEKRYLPIDAFDRSLYQRATVDLADHRRFVPSVPIRPGYNTNQVLNYGYTHWYQMFNNRQLVCLAMLGRRVQQIEDPALRAVFTVLFSGCLEFNNMFCSYKGEGTGAVRHMFAHHILKPERTPLEANVWGTPKSSGAFSTLFESRILRAIDYKDHPFEVRVRRDNGKIVGEKVYGLSDGLEADIEQSYEAFELNRARAYLSCGDSAKTDLPDCSVDAVITDPPFFDNVHYSELADFFYVWQRQILPDNKHHANDTTRNASEVQSTCAETFAHNLSLVFAECARVLKPQGVLAFTYHHSRSEGWAAVLEAISKGGFRLVASHPVKAEMAVGVPKTQAKEPIDLDIVLVGRKKLLAQQVNPHPLDLSDVCRRAGSQIERLNRVGRSLSVNDVRVILMGQVIVALSEWDDHLHMLNWLHDAESQLGQSIDRLWREQKKSQEVAQPKLF